MIVCDPVQQPLPQDPVTAAHPAPRLDSLNGKTIGLWNNEKLNAALLLEMIREELEGIFDFKVLHGTYDAGNLMPADGWGAIDLCDAVILANGDCGACSTSGIVNAIELEKRGIPAILVGTQTFDKAITASAELRGMPDIRWALIEHPVASLVPDTLRERARDAARQIPALLTGD